MVNAAGPPSAPRPSIQVLVVGAGPVGLTAAHELARRGLRVRLIDAAPGPARTSRAVATHPRTLETYDQMGIVDDVLPRGRRNQAFTMYAGGRRRVRLEADYATMPTRYPYTLVVEQTETEAVLRAAVARLGVRVEWGVRLADFTQAAQEVHARLVHADGGEEECTASWLVGCDGGHSTVRKRLGLELLGESSETWMLADAPVDTEVAPDSIYWAHTGGQALMMVPYAREGHWRLLDTVPAACAQEPGRAEEQFSRKLSAGLGHPVRVGEASWTSVFTFQQRMVERMQDGRVLVAGDAAHVHSPASGQGMNTGIQEAYNLAWKLAMVEQGHAGRELLETYSEERVPLGAALLGSTRTATTLVQLKNALAGVVLPLALSVVQAVRPLRRAVQRKVLGGMSGLKVAYDTSSLTGTDHYYRLADAGCVQMSAREPGREPGPGARVTAARVHDGDDPAASAFRAELRDPRWTLLLAAGGHGPGDVPVGVAVTAAAQYGEWLSVRTVGGTGPDGPAPLADPDLRLRTALGLGPGAWILVRPDGYVAARGTLLTRPSLRRALAPLQTPVPLADEARREPGPTVPVAVHDLEEH
ncbi:oxygenase [Streptomyces yokosukanensis]|uniref:Oxygenase n=1 Tax=Streptomyces yokosukanensis TaxID=67386 RepID=A0A124HEE2_9ACTN|nr:FAD-dependent oxidoreductase [Streptomyces yokosukanensis]KUN00432.1 oxygenase [Streptomyces yokosukanensis]